MFFFFQAEDGIRDLYVTGVQTCALPILRASVSRSRMPATASQARTPAPERNPMMSATTTTTTTETRLATSEVSTWAHRTEDRARSEERRVGKECRARGAPCEYERLGAER